MSSPLSRLFDPKTIAVVGASQQRDKAGYQLLEGLQPFPGKLYPVNPRATEIQGLRAYPSLAAIPEPVDLVLLAVPQVAAPAVLREAADVRAGAAMIVSGGFGETGAEGQKLQDEIAAICKAGGVRLLGPNTSGFCVPPKRLYASFLPTLQEIAPGPIAIVAQSGGINISAAFEAHAQGRGLALAVGLGNAPDIGFADVLAHLAADPDVKAIALHLEGVPRGRALYDTLRATTERTPVAALAVGRADIGAFAQSHTGNLMGNFALTRAMLRQAGAVVVDTIGDLIDAAHALSRARLPAKQRPGVGILTGQAGSGLLILDTLKTAGVAVPEIAPATVKKIEALLPPMTYMKNPVDTGRPEKTFGAVMQALAADPTIDAVLVNALYEPASMTPVEDVAGALPAGKAILFSSGGTAGSVGPVFEGLEALGVATFTTPDRAARAMTALDADARARARRGDHSAVQRGNTLPAGTLDEDAAKSLVETFGIRTPRRIVCADRPAVRAAFAKLGAPAVVKVLDAAITHKTEVGGVHVNLRDNAALNAALDAIDRIPGRHRYLVEEQAKPGVELIVGGLNDPSYGPSVLVGLGGIAAEALGDVAMRLAPLSAAEAEDMLDDLRGKKLLDGFRGAPAANRAALVQAIVAVGRLMAAHPEIRELDLNPVRAYPDGVVALDAVVVVGG